MGKLLSLIVQKNYLKIKMGCFIIYIINLFYNIYKYLIKIIKFYPKIFLFINNLY